MRKVFGRLDDPIDIARAECPHRRIGAEVFRVLLQHRRRIQRWIQRERHADDPQHQTCGEEDTERFFATESNC